MTCIMYIYVIIKYVDRSISWYGFTPGIPYSMPILTSPLNIGIVMVAVLLKLCCEYNSWRLNRPELTTIHRHLRPEHTTQSLAYHKTTTEWPRCPLGHADILLHPVVIHFNRVLTGILICMLTWDITCANEISFLVLGISYILDVLMQEYTKWPYPVQKQKQCNVGEPHTEGKNCDKWQYYWTGNGL